MKLFIYCLPLLVLFTGGCSSEQLKSATYNSLKNSDCMETHGYPNCHADQPEYEEYKKQREEVVN